MLGTNAAPVAAPLARDALAQLAASLVRVGRTPSLQRLEARVAGSVDAGVVQHLVAQHLASLGDTDGALARLRETLRVDPGFDAARALACRLLVRQARASAVAGDQSTVRKALEEARGLASDRPDLAGLFEGFSQVVAELHARSGRREDAMREMRRTQEDAPTRLDLLHQMALLHYWEAVSLQSNADEACVEHWRAAVDLWTALVHTPAFWSEFVERRRVAWHVSVDEASVATAREQLLDERFISRFRDAATAERTAARPERAKWYDDLVAHARLEQRSARLWARALPSAAATAVVAHPALAIGGGRSFLSQHGAIDSAREIATGLRVQHGEEEDWLWLTILLRDDGLGLALVHCDDLASPGHALELLDREATRTLGPEASLLRSRVLLATGKANAGGEGAEALVRTAAAARACAISGLEVTRETVLRKLLSEAASAASAWGCEVATREATRLKREEKLDDAIRFLESLLALDAEHRIRDLLCVYLCDRASTSARTSVSRARTDCNRALQLDNLHARARELLSATYNNEGVDEKNNDRAIKLLEQAVETWPHNQVAKRNLAGRLNGKAHDLITALLERRASRDPRSVLNEGDALLWRAMSLAAPHVKKSDVDKMLLMAAIDIQLVEAAFAGVGDALLRTILSNLAVVVAIRAKIGR